MATQEKLLKSLESLRTLMNSNQNTDGSAKRKDKIQHCNFITEAMSNSTIKIAPNFVNLLSFSLEVFLQLCDDPESDVRMIADESLNRIIKAMADGNIGKVQIELHKEIKKNGSARSLRAALSRFAQLSHLIRPHKGKPYVVNLVPSIVKICEREEEMLHETLASSLPKIMSSLGSFTTDNDIKMLLKGFLNNIQNQSALIRRTTASCILTICLNCRKPFVFITFVLNNLIDSLMPVQENQSSALILGVLGCLKLILPYIRTKVSSREEEIQGSFGVRKESNEVPVAIDKLLQSYELCLYYTSKSDHNIVNAAMEALNVLLQSCPPEMKAALLSPHGIDKSRILLEEGSLKPRSPSQHSIATTLLSGDENLAIESDLTETLKTDIEKWIDESKLSVINVTYVNKPETPEKQHTVSVSDTATTGSSFEHIDSSDYSNITIGMINDNCAESTKSESFIDNLDKLILSEESSEKSYSHFGEDPQGSSNGDVVYQEVDVGSFTDREVPLIHCCRHLCKSFLLTGNPGNLIPDKVARVTVKSLALSCLSTIFQMYPEGLLRYLDKNYGNNVVNQQISDIVLFHGHSDPQLRGAVQTLISCFLKSVFLRSDGDYSRWIIQNCLVDEDDVFSLDKLYGIIVQGLEDESSICTAQSLSGILLFLNYAIESKECAFVVPVLKALPALAKNRYWIVKVRLLKLLSELEYVTIEYITGTSGFQNTILHNVMFELLKDEDAKVRNAASSALVKIIPFLYYQQDDPDNTTVTNKAIAERKKYLSNLSNIDFESNITRKNFLRNLPFPFCEIGKKGDDEMALSRIVAKLTHFLLTFTSKYFIQGCIETLCLLSQKYPTTTYTNAWSCFRNFPFTPEKPIVQRTSPSANNPPPAEVSCITDLFSVCVNLLTHSTFSYDFALHLNLLQFTGNLFAGKCLNNFKTLTEINPEETKQIWSFFSDKELAELSEQFLNHVVKLLNVFAHVLEEAVPALPQVKTVLPNLPAASSLSPIKRRKSDLSEKMKIAGQKTPEKEDKERRSESARINSMGYFVSIPHYMKVYEMLKIAYNNYKITLESEASKNFINLLNTTLKTLSQLLEVATLVESGRISEELLGYLRATFTLDAPATVKCVQQLLKSLFGSNLTANISEISAILTNGLPDNESEVPSGFYFNISQKPYNEISSCFRALHNVNKFDCNDDSTVMGYLHRREVKKTVLAKGSDKILASYIRIFEPMVIKSLKQYTITSDVKLQSEVLQLLSQLVQLRVNYCLLDSEQIFIGFVLKQFEFIEEGQITYTKELIPRIFEFLVHLSYGKQHSKSIIGVPKLIQLCDGLMASGQSPITHCIPALKPIVEDIFLMRNKSNTPDLKELETTREVLLSIMLRLLEYRDVVELLVLILNDCKYCDSSDKWLRWSKQVVDVLLPMLKMNKIRLDNVKAFVSLRKLIFTLNPNAFKPVNEVLVLMFQKPPNFDDSSIITNRWLGKVLILLLILGQIKEEFLLLKMAELQADFDPACIFANISFTPDPLNVTAYSNFLDGLSPQLIFVRFIFRTIEIAIQRCLHIAQNEEDGFLVEQLSLFLMCCLYILQSGSHCKITNVAMDLINDKDKLKKNEIDLEKLNVLMLRVAVHYPLLSFQWCYFLTLLNYHNCDFWMSVLDLGNRDNELSSVNLEIVKTGGCIVFCDYLTEHVTNEKLSRIFDKYINLLIELSNEATVLEMLATINRNPSSSFMFLEAITTKCIRSSNVVFKTKLLSTIENVHSSQTGNLLRLLVTDLLDTRQLALSRMVANLASRKIEYLLTLSMEEVHEQLPKEHLMKIMEYLIRTKLANKHETLVSLLNKLSTQFYDLSPIEIGQRRTVNPNYIKKLHINKNWFLSQVKSRSSSSTGLEIAELLSHLEYDNITEIMTSSDFNKSVTRDCIIWCCNKLKNGEIQEDFGLLKASVDVVLNDVSSLVNLVPASHQVYDVVDRQATQAEDSYTFKLTEIFNDNTTWNLFLNTIPSISPFLGTSADFALPETSKDDLLKFAVICLESINYVSNIERTNLNVNLIDESLTCADVIFKNKILSQSLSLKENHSWLCSSVNSIYKLVINFLMDDEPLPSVSKSGLSGAMSTVATLSAGHCCYQLATLVAWLEKINNHSVVIPKFIFKRIRSVVICLARLPLVNSYILTPPSAWKNGLQVDLSGPFFTVVPPLPVKFLQEVEVLEEFIFRISLLGWTSRQQFEETWMCLLSVLSSCPSEYSIPEEINAITHASSLAVRAITSLLIDTMYVPVPGNRNISKLIHVPRDLHIREDTASIRKLKSIHNNFTGISEQFSKSSPTNLLVDVFNKPNLEKKHSHYSYSQVSVEYLLISAKIVEIDDSTCLAAQVYRQRQKILDDHGLDLNSCLQFLLDLYSQWMKSRLTTPLRVLHEVMKSILLISDLLTDKSQLSWILEACLELAKVHTQDDEVLHQYLVIGVCKSAGVLMPGIDTLESVKKMLTQSLRSPFLPTRIASLHGLLYILQGCILGNTIIGGVSEETQLFLPVAVEYVTCNINVTHGVLHQSQEHNLLLWALSFYLIENIDGAHFEDEFVEVVVRTALNTISIANVNNSLYSSILKGLERLIIKKSLSEKLNNQIRKFALGKMRDVNHVIALPAVQLLLSCMYTECAEQLELTERYNGIVQSNPDNLVQTIEKVSAIFDKIKRGYPSEVELLCAVLPEILNDFFPPSDILTKVIGEFLSPQQRHPKLLSRVVFQVFECAIQQSQLLLLQDWVVFSLDNFTHSFSIGMATWCLTCFFISASTNRWLRALFPHVQSRIGRYEYEDRKMLCIAAADFYNNLTNEKQKQTFIEAFAKVKDQADMPYNELLASL